MSARTWRGASVLVAAAMTVAACTSSDPQAVDDPRDDTSSTTDVATVTNTDLDVGVIAESGGLAEGWEDYGWTSIITDDDVAVDIGEWGGIILGNPTLEGSYIAVQLTVSVDEDLPDEFLIVELADDIGTASPSMTPEWEISGDSRSTTVLVTDLRSSPVPFDRIILAAAQEFPSPTEVGIEEIVFVAGEPEFNTATDTVEGAAVVECAAETQPISPYIYGTARPGFGNDAQWSLGITSRRWGGNPTSRYNWRTGTWNTALDYYWENVDVGNGGIAHEEFLVDNWANGVDSVVTVPMTGWVSKDDFSNSFPISVFGEQQDSDVQFRPDAGNGVSPDGEPLEPPAPTATSIAADPAYIGEFVRSMEALADDTGNPSPLMYILDNEPMLWHDTHRDVIAEPMTYDELLSRSIAYGEAVREEAPFALIAGPALWGWPAYFFSALDAQQGFESGLDRRQHGDIPLVEWYLQQMKEYEDRTGVRLLDVLDVHFYPQDGSFSDDVSAEASARRLRATRSLWDPNYLAESWVDERIQLIPRMQAWVDDNYPGTLLSIGEYAFGAESHMSGGIAQAEALGRFGQNGLYSAYYWVSPPADTPVYWAFRAFRDYDGNGSSFGDISVPTTSSRPLSVFASTTDADESTVVIALNSSPDEEIAAEIDVADCGRSEVLAYSYSGQLEGYEPSAATVEDGAVVATLPPYSITVFELR